MRVFLDTNVLASAAATRGLCVDILREVLTSHELFTCEQVMKELTRVLRTKFGVPTDLVEDFILWVRQDAVIAQPGPPLEVAIQDQDDLPILSAAISVGAEVFVTGDKELLKRGQINNMAILSPRQFWEKWKAKSQRGVGREKSRRARWRKHISDSPHP